MLQRKTAAGIEDAPPKKRSLSFERLLTAHLKWQFTYKTRATISGEPSCQSLHQLLRC
jgi:hypothetical protein